ncbi:DUF3392 family protein [Hydrogenovibrio halophilus]|uniref:DUF3392 family protein n=1 Tax=Hydrogenovibrio halophilus TaxID=373391 RepID=UPI00036AC992|nr:DUF3392 family protein [Hydrogenovibrio halophilus]
MEATIGWLSEQLIAFSLWLRPYLGQLVLAMVASLLVIFGNDLMALLKQQLGSLAWFLKVTLFVLFCAVGFGLLTSFFAPLLTALLDQLDRRWLGLVVVAAFYGIGWLAQKKGLL